MKASLISCICITLLILFQPAVGANRYWVAASASSWNNTVNWSATSGGAGGASVPGSLDAAIFNGSGLGNCTINIPVTVTSINVNAAYTGTIAQGTNTISTSSTATFSGGTFTGGSANITITGTLTVNGAVFTSTSATLELNGNSSFSTGSFNHNNGTVRYNYTGSGSVSISGSGTYILNNLEFVGTGHTYNLPTANMSVLGGLYFTGSQFYTISSGTIDAAGDINLNNTASGCAGSALINIMGSGIQSLNGNSTAGTSALPKLTINKPSGTLNFNNIISVSSHFTFTAGTINLSSSTICFTDGTTSPLNITGNFTFNKVMFTAAANQVFTVVTGNIIATGDLTIGGTANVTLNTGTINVIGDVSLLNSATGGGGTATINIIGTGNQLMDASTLSTGQCKLPNLNLNKSNGTLTLKGIISESQDWTYTSGTIDASTWSSTVVFGGTVLNIKSVGMSFYNFAVNANTSKLISNLSVSNDITINGGILSAGAYTINLAGNWNNTGTAGFTESSSIVNLNGSAVQTITSPGGENFSTLTINNTSAGIRLNNDITVAATLNMTLGNIDLNGNGVTLGLSTATNGVLARSSGIMFNTGSFTRWWKAVTVADGAIGGLFPTGTSTNYRPIFISAPSTAASAGGTVSVSYIDRTTNTSTMIADGLFTVLLRKDLYWVVSTGNGLSGGSYNLRIDGTGMGSIGSVSDLRITLSNSVVGSAGVNGGTINNPQITRTGLTSTNLGNNFFVGTIDPANTTLPQTFLSFTAETINDKVELNWEVGGAVNSGLFTVQRSSDGLHWEAINEVRADESSGSYHVVDANPYRGSRGLYRIMKNDIDGRTMYSAIVIVSASNNNSFSVYPNPAKGFINVNSDKSSNAEISLLTTAGSVIMKTASNVSGNTILDITHLNGGLYYIVVNIHGQANVRPVFICR